MRWGLYEAAVWQGTAASYLNIGQSGLHTEARATDGQNHVGIAWRDSAPIEEPTGRPDRNAFMMPILWPARGGLELLRMSIWTATTNEEIDFNQGFGAAAMAMDGPSIVGFGLSSSQTRAVLWNFRWDGFSSTRDLHPLKLGFTDSMALGIAHDVAAGWGYYYGRFHAIAWRNMAPPYPRDVRYDFDLHEALPPGYEESAAHGVGIYGDIVGWASPTTSVNRGDTDRVPVRWIYRPKPTQTIFQIGTRDATLSAQNGRGEGWILMEKRVPKGGITLTLSSSAPTAVSVPESVMVGSEEDVAVLPLTLAPGAYPKDTTKTFTVKATYAGITREMPVTVTY
jgi:hypothetical protein